MYKKTQRKLTKYDNEKKKVKHLVIAAVVLALVFVCLRLLALNVAFCEFMTRTVCRWLLMVTGTVTSVTSPISLYEIMLAVIILTALYLIVLAVWQAKNRLMMQMVSTLLVVVVGALSFLCTYNFSAGFAYNRAAMPLPMRDAQMRLTDVREYATAHVEEFNRMAENRTYLENGYVASPYTFAQLNDILKTEYARLDDDYFSPFTPTVKQIACSHFMSNLHLTGIAFSPLGEANVNRLTPNRSLPIVMAHEMAHIKGVMREDDANLLAYYICLTSQDEYVRYCAYSYTLGIVLNPTYYVGDNFYSELYSKISPKIKNEYAAINKFWASNSFFSDIADFFNDLYLKFNGTGGTSDYTDPGSTNNSTEVPDAQSVTVTLSVAQRMIFGLKL